MYNIKTEKNEKAVIATVEGFFDDETAKNYVNELQKAADSVLTKSYTLVVDASQLSITKKDLTDDLTGAMKMYVSLGFKKVAIVKPNSFTATSQIKRIIKKENLPIELVNSVKDGTN